MKKRILAQFSLILALAACQPAGEMPTAAASATPTDGLAAAAPLMASPTISPTPDSGIIIGKSVEGRPIRVYRFGHGTLKLVMVGGLHGGYEGNTVALGYAMIDHFEGAPGELDGLTLLIVPNANPDAVAAFTKAGGRLTPDDTAAPPDRWRANAHDVDLNRNWDCSWEATGEWAAGTLSGGSAPFSEPETRALRELILLEQPQAAIFWHSAAGAVLGGGCGDNSAFDVSKGIAGAYAEAAGYTDHGEGFSSSAGYRITGDASNWVSGQRIPAITVELTTHAAPELDENLAGLWAAIDYINARPWLLGG